ncbi:MAG TPA: ABC transporter ATP-binding protein [Patescibacteria group bacterium]|nr:ABC transporter ATP-binding protein [Patescibacteria group bacterium]
MIAVHNVEKTYDNDGVKTKALTNATFDIGTGEFLSIMGPSGSGKSTLMHILGLLDRATGGTYLLDNKDVAQFSDDALATLRNKKIGFVFQAFNLLPKTNVFENVELPLLYDAHPIENNEKKVHTALEAVGMSHRIGYLSNQLSGGEKQRVAIARALVNNPDIIFADEPTGNLDSKSGLQVMAILQSLNNAGRTIVLVTHETYTAEHAKRILLMKDGQIVDDQPVVNRRHAAGEQFLK